jgi:hypothetical protein
VTTAKEVELTMKKEAPDAAVKEPVPAGGALGVH